jgi:peptidoglycan/xylan/chitin deacetylase (PgdA/CDA1 family)
MTLLGAKSFLTLLFVSCLPAGSLAPSAHASQAADGIVLMRQKMPANYCALTFDDGPGPHTSALLDVLAKRGVAATFFVSGKYAEQRPALIKRMLAEGHEVGNHGYSHADMTRLEPEAQFLEMKKTQDLLQTLGAKVRYFRPAYGNYDEETIAKAEELGLTIMLWSMDSNDWKPNASPLELMCSVSPKIQQSLPGMRGVFLFHDTLKDTVENMPFILDALIADGCEHFVTASEYMKPEKLAPRAARKPVRPSDRRCSVMDFWDAFAGVAPSSLRRNTYRLENHNPQQ